MISERSLPASIRIRCALTWSVLGQETRGVLRGGPRAPKAMSKLTLRDSAFAVLRTVFDFQHLQALRKRPLSWRKPKHPRRKKQNRRRIVNRWWQRRLLPSLKRRQ